VGNSIVNLTNEVESILREKDRQGVEAWLQLLQAWLREAFLLQQHGDAKEAPENDARTKLIARFPGAHLDEAIDSVERAIADTQRNVYLPVILNSLAHELRRHIAVSHSS
jgi:hypothetical protein